MVGHVVVEHMADGRNIQPARRHVRRYQNFQRLVFEPGQGVHAGMLVHVAMNGAGIVAVALQRAQQGAHVALAVAKDNGIANFFAVEQGAQRQTFGLWLNRGRHQPLGEVVGSGGRWCRFNPHRIVQKGVRQPLNFRRHGG